jgi:hypothetical protein
MSICKNIDYYDNRLNIIDNFYLYDYDLSYFNTSYIWEKISFDRHSKRVLKIEDTSLVILKILDLSYLTHLSNYLGENNDCNKYYLILIRVNLDHNLECLNLDIFKMKNVMFFSFDLRDHILKSDEIEPLRGVTIPSPYKFNNDKINILIKNDKYLFSFKGDCSQNGWFGCADVRQKFKRLCKNYTSNSINYLYEDTCDPDVSSDKILYETILSNSIYGLVLHGDGRWSHRLVETFGSGAIPVIISDGLTLPFEQIIDYSNACIILNENIIYNAENLDEFINYLPKDNETINKMRDNSLKIYEMFFSSDEKICDMLLLCAKIEIEKQNCNL